MVAGGIGKFDTFNDLGTGASYGSVPITRTDAGTIVEISLNADAVDFLNGVVGQFAFGGALSGTGWAFALSGPEICANCIRELVLEQVPIPASVTIDIMPSKKTENVINLKKKNLKVAILGSIEFDALQVDPATVKFGTFDPDAASPTRYKGQDYNRDGYSDLILIFKRNETGIVCIVTEATLTGETYAGEAIEGSDNFTVHPCP